jgi:hypothetical protein
MRKILAILASTLVLAFGVAIPSDAGPTAPIPGTFIEKMVAHPESTIEALTNWFDAYFFGPEDNFVNELADRSVHYGYHYSEHCWYVGVLVAGPKYHLLYNIDTGDVHWLDYDSWCFR